ncbi:MAG: ankyrin repeat domain-containing protein [Cytophagales bacterium]|nr:ankyrin repeat domain-containing protein [Cytophagales bacterium]
MKFSKTNSSRSLVLISLFFLASCTNEPNKQSSDSASTKAPSTSIHEAAFFGNTEVILAHIEAKTDLNQKDEYGSTPLSIAATFGKIDVAIALIKGGANLNTQSADGSTALHTAAFFCRENIVDALLEAGADTGIRNNYGSTAMESISGPFENVKMIYDQISKDLGPMGLKLDYNQIRTTRPVIAKRISDNL